MKQVNLYFSKSRFKWNNIINNNYFYLVCTTGEKLTELIIDLMVNYGLNYVVSII